MYKKGMQRVMRRKMSNVMFWQINSSGIDLKLDRYPKYTSLDASASPARCNLTLLRLQSMDLCEVPVHR